jgi:predicted Zn-dependent protease
MLARAHLADGAPALAEQNLREAMAAVPADVTVQRELGELMIQTGHTELAVRLLERTVLDHPRDREAQDVLIRARLAGGKLEAARLAAQNLLTLAPDWWPAYRDLAEAQAASGDVAAALASYEAGIKATDYQPELVVGLAALYEHQRRIDEALAAYERLRQRRPDLVLAANNLAMLLVTYRSDQPSLDRARDLAAGLAHASNGALLDTYGWVQLKRGEIAAALATLERAAVLSPGSAAIRCHLGVAQFRAGETGKARATLEAALSGRAEFAGREEARSVLEQLQRRAG